MDRNFMNGALKTLKMCHNYKTKVGVHKNRIIFKYHLQKKEKNQH